MSTMYSEFEIMLRDAVNKAKAAAPRAVDDLVRCASEAAKAVANVTGGAAVLELVPDDQRKDATPTYQLQLRKIGSDAPPSNLGIYRVTSTGYPVLRWYSRGNWEKKPNSPDKQFPGFGELEGHFKWMLSHPDSKLVALVAFFQQQPTAETNKKTENKSKPGK